MNRISKILTQPNHKAAAQSMFYALGLKQKDLNKPQIGIGSVYYDSNPCNSKLYKLANTVQDSINKENMIGFKFNTIGVSDGISMGTEGMRYSLPSRELIADSIETIAGAHYYDGLVLIPGCDKNLPASLMALLRLNRPGFIIYGGAMAPNYYKQKKLDIVSTFESYGEFINNKINNEEFRNIIQNACNKDCGACSGLYTANTMASILEVMGITLPNSSSNPSLSNEKFDECLDAGNIMENLIKNNIKPSDIITQESFKNSIILTYLLGGSTNAVIHLLAIARNANIDLDLNDFVKYQNIPVLTNMKPHGEYVMNDIYKYGGMTSLLKYFIDEKYINGEILTITGTTLNENLKEYTNPNNEIKNVIKKMKDNSHIKILKGKLAPEGCVAKVYTNLPSFTKRAKVFDSEVEMINSLKEGKINRSNAIIIRYQGESIGCPEMLNATSALVGYFGNENVPPLLTDGRFSGGSRGILIAHLPDAFKDNSITKYINNNDLISIDLENNEIDIAVDYIQLLNRKRYHKEKMVNYNYSNSYLKKYNKLVGNINDGYMT